MKRIEPGGLSVLGVGVVFIAVASAAAQPIGTFQAALQTPQQAVEGWNGSRVRELIERAVARRATWAGDAELADYRARATGHIYFLFDLGRDTQRHLVRADQLALDLFWRAPALTRQVIVGRREEKALPTNIRYHLDHLTVVMDNFGDRISLGEGSEVREVMHPAAPGALAFYDYRLADSLTLVLPERELRVYKVEMRPRDPDGPGLVGTLYLDRGSADIVQMEFTFTAGSYLDETLDYFSVRIENALWANRYWLPRRQGIELRRGIEPLNFPAGGIIRAEFKITDYEFNVGTPPGFFRGPSVYALPKPLRDSFAFEGGLYDALDPKVATAPPSLEAIRENAGRIIADSYLERARGLRPAVPGVSSIIRLRRAEGLYLGPALSRDYPFGVRTLISAGYALGRDRWQLAGQLTAPLAGPVGLELAGYVERAAETAVWEPSSGVIATLATLLDGEDYREPYWASGGRLTLRTPWGPRRVGLAIAWEEWEAAALEAGEVVDRGYRPVRRLDEGRAAWLALEMKQPPTGALERVGGVAWEGRIEGATSAVAGDFEYVRVAARGERLWPRAGLGLDLRIFAGAGLVSGGRIPAQRLLPAGGRGTVRGYPFHRFVGDVYGGGGLELRRPVVYPLVSVAAFADAGWVGRAGSGAGAGRAIDAWNREGRLAGSARGPLIGVGAGVGLLFDIVRVELARGLRQGGIWELVVSVRPEFWAWL